MGRLALVDFDDTLVETAPAFQEARDALFRLLEEKGFPRELSYHVHHEEVDPDLLAEHGMGPFRMESSFRETYRRLCRKRGANPDEGTIEACGALGRDFLGRPRVMDGSLGALMRLAQCFRTVIFSQSAQAEYQLGRIRDAGVTGILPEERIWITDHKSPETLRQALLHFGVQDPADAVMIGNSIRSDINPALREGVEAILVEPYEMWHYDNVPPISNHFRRFPSFPEAVDYLCPRTSP